jgi:hypothetical protein
MVKQKTTFIKAKARAKPWKTFLKKSFPNLSKNFT